MLASLRPLGLVLTTNRTSNHHTELFCFKKGWKFGCEKERWRASVSFYQSKRELCTKCKYSSDMLKRNLRQQPVGSLWFPWKSKHEKSYTTHNLLVLKKMPKKDIVVKAFLHHLTNQTHIMCGCRWRATVAFHQHPHSLSAGVETWYETKYLFVHCCT